MLETNAPVIIFLYIRRINHIAPPAFTCTWTELFLERIAHQLLQDSWHHSLLILWGTWVTNVHVYIFFLIHNLNPAHLVRGCLLFRFQSGNETGFSFVIAPDILEVLEPQASSDETAPIWIFQPVRSGLTLSISIHGLEQQCVLHWNGTVRFADWSISFSTEHIWP